MQYWLQNETETLAFSAQLSQVFLSGVIFLHGPLGAGKTTFVKGFLQGLGYRGLVKSPTYTLVESYALPQKEIFHFDLYRITDPEELLYFGFEDYFTPQSICLIEWPERAKKLLPAPTLSCYLEISSQGLGRFFSCEAGSITGQNILKQWTYLIASI